MTILNRHPGEGRDPRFHVSGSAQWIPAFAGMTTSENPRPSYCEAIAWRRLKGRRNNRVKRLDGKVVWGTGGGSGIGEAAAMTRAAEGAAMVLTGRREAPLNEVAEWIRDAGGTAHVQPGDLTDPAAVRRIGDYIRAELGRLDILLNNAGVNINDRHWDKLTPENAQLMIAGNLAAAAQCVTVALPIMRPQQDGLIIHTASMAGRFIGGVPGPLYTAAKHGIVAMSHSNNNQECADGLPSRVFLPR